jgi:urease accessory protein
MVAELIPVTQSLLQVQTHLKTVDLHIARDRTGNSFVHRQYTTYPFRLSRSLPLDPTDPSRAYLYLMNSAPGLFARDNWQLSLQLNAGTKLYLTDQSSTKVHRMAIGETARATYEMTIGANAYLEYLPEPIILYTDAALEQITKVVLHPTGNLFLSEIIVPGRLARKEFYQFQHYLSRLRVVHASGELIFADTMRLIGQVNPFFKSPVFATLPILANIVLVSPDIDLHHLRAVLAANTTNQTGITAASSCLPNCNGLLIRAMAENTSLLKTYIHSTLNWVRQMSQQPNLPNIPK